MLLTSFIPFVSLFLFPTAQALTYSDGPVQPVPTADYNRTNTFWGNGTRTYTCDPTGNTTFVVSDLNYNLYDAVPTINTTLLIGRRVYLAKPDVYGGQFAFYTKVGAFTYWVGRALKEAPNPVANPSNLPLELELVTERSEPRLLEAGKYDLGQATWVTRWGCKGGELPAGTKCNATTAKLIIPNTCYYSFWQRFQ